MRYCLQSAKGTVGPMMTISNHLEYFNEQWFLIVVLG